ncbi:hypothetical protein LIA77_00414 [Sarocladium implicatum]|nr:hypothetical protein LIA77_00414 [Sarocladium implicatum]
MDFAWASMLALRKFSGMCVVGLRKCGKGDQQRSVASISTSEPKPSASLIQPAQGASPYGPAFSKILLMDTDEWISGDSDPKIIAAFKNHHQGLSDLRSAAQLVSEIIRALWDEAKTRIKAEAQGDSTPSIHVVIAHPMTWKPDTIARFKTAVELSGVNEEAGSVDFLSESQAAARAVFWDHQHVFKTQRKAEPVIIIDGGGITIDSALCQPQGCKVLEPRSRLYGKLSVDFRYADAVQSIVTSQAAQRGIKLSSLSLKGATETAMIKWRDLNSGRHFDPSIPTSTGPEFPSPIGLPARVHRDDMLGIYMEVGSVVAEAIAFHVKPGAAAATSKPKKVYMIGGLCVCVQLKRVIEHLLCEKLGEDAPELVLS